MNGDMELTTRARLRRSASMTALVVLGVVALSGCFKLDMSLELSSDNTVDGSIILAVDRDQAELFGGEEALRESLSGEGSGLLGEDPATGSVETQDYEDDDWIGNEYVFTDVALDEFSGDETGDLSITREGDAFVVEGTLDLSQGTETDPSASALLESAETEISITFPGDVESSNGVEDGNTVTWTPVPGEVTEISAVGSAEAGLPWTLIAAVFALLTFVVVGIVLLVVLRGRESASAPAAGPLPEGSIVPAGPERGAEPSECACRRPAASGTPGTSAAPPRRRHLRLAERCCRTVTSVRFTDFWERMETHLGSSYARSYARDHVLSELEGRTAEQALADGEDATRVWRAVVAALDLPARYR